MMVVLERCKAGAGKTGGGRAQHATASSMLGHRLPNVESSTKNYLLILNLLSWCFNHLGKFVREKQGDLISAQF